MSRRRKQQIRNMLKDRDLQAVKALAKESSSALRLFFSETYHADPLIQWRAIEAIGYAAEIQASSRMPRIQDFVRRLFWLMNDESGGLGWRAPEAIGEIFTHIPALADKLAPLLPQYFVEEPFERGTFFAVYRVATQKPELFETQIETLNEALANQDKVIGTYALLALEAMDAVKDLSAVQSMLKEDLRVPYYDFSTGELSEISPKFVARRILA